MSDQVLKEILAELKALNRKIDDLNLNEALRVVIARITDVESAVTNQD